MGLLLSALSARLASEEGRGPWLAGVAAILAAGCFVRVLLVERHSAARARQAAPLAHDPAPIEPPPPMSDLPTSEALFARIGQEIEAGGLLGVVTLADFRKLSVFEPELARQAFAVIVERARRMLGEDRLIAHVDRARLAIWYDAGWTAEAALAQLDALAYALGDAIRDGDREILPEIRIGTARAPQDGIRPDILLARAIGGIGPSGEGEDADPVEAARQHYGLEQDLRRAIDRKELELHFQPLIDAKAGRVFGAEALLRWNHREQGHVPPSLFVPIMEASDLADEVGLWVLNRACREARDWQREGLPGLRVAVNISGRQLGRVDLARLIERTLTRHSLSPGTLEIELTETVAAIDVQHSARLFQHLRELGVAIAIDDFGTGYSSFSTLRKMTFDKMKIDREFITDVDQRADSQAICRAILALGKGLGIRVVAEGVERRSEYLWLRRHGCIHFQGYYFAPPLDAAAFRDFVRDEDLLSERLAADPPERLRA
ncbi:EAL domain-containing protein [Sphingomonas oligoaromativorans]|uniref:putative bifunctional diguanylate cyclase/phosphodiesterase n=1 Tax=Sphingomonas oligoaromativorans TaxID=575322 RepID=UPI0031330BC7|nr:Amt family ammonium transporter [Sphingomonas oligoaromativorans]